ncbi:RHE_PE00001 family protein [Agrobacterium salinitolerans]|uniref:RHE_PE00001 family protein n=1 Tax=Agrobacterium salinitolerans TaxID=1183413 RepID=A0A4Z1QM12_9HYPH|nr:RHE_PE00001 family protein [Agrobacterium salinitolerans]UYZ09740.1 RHE_PE00001 family protein [Agrobacterium salinitolerans]
MIYDISDVQIEKLLIAAARAGEALARLDERIDRSTMKQGFIERQDFTDAISSMWVDGELVHMEDLVLHDAHMDVRAPTHEMTAAHRILRSRRLIFSNASGWAFTAPGLSRLRGRAALAEEPAPPRQTLDHSRDEDADAEEETSLDGAFSELDALLARSAATLDAITTGGALQPMHREESHAIINEPDWDEDERLKEWWAVLARTEELPAILRTAILLDAWNMIEVLQRSPWLGRLLVSAFLRDGAVTPAHLPALSAGLRAIPRERRHARNQTQRIAALLDSFYEAAQAGMKEHDRLTHARERMMRKLAGRRSSSRLPELVELVVSRPVVSAAMIVKELGTTPQGAIGLANQLELREVTGRGRFRAWGML